MNALTLRYAISDRNTARAEGLSSPAIQAAQLAAEGIDFFQLREKDLPAGDLATLARDILHVLTGTPTRLLINGRADVAIATDAHGVHLSSSPDELTAEQIHRLYSAAGQPPPVVAVSCHSLEEVTRQHGQPVTAILFGPVFGKTLQGKLVTDGLGLDLLEQACRFAASVPILALGGVTEENAPSCLAAGASGIAGIRLFRKNPLRPL